MTTERIDSVMLVSNGCNPDPRVQKEARSLAARGYRVQVWAWDRSAQLPPRETRDGYEIVRYARASRTGTSLRQLSGFLGFWLWAMRRGFRGERPRLVHCHDIDVFIPAFFLSRRWRVPLVLDSHELYGEMQASAGRPKPLVALLRWVERRFVRLAHAAIVVGNATREYFMRVRPDLTIVGNWYEPVENAGPLRDAVRQELGIPPDVFVITFVGGLQTTKFLEPLIEAVDADE
ncbi:MAG TPA: glycosyltransferase, partial [Thermoanaerobaculia bacterium]|nr:glycosyltransferase [Thermoanaerobaculia bacterium]